MLIKLALIINSLIGISQAREPSPLYWYQAVDLGFGTVSPYRAPELSRDGGQHGIRTLGSYGFHPDWTVEGGVGWQWGKRSAYNSDQSFTKTIHRGFFIEPGLKYSINRNWLAGPFLMLSMASDVGLGDGSFTDSSGKNLALFGVEALYQIPGDDLAIHRIGGRIGTDLNIPGRTARWYQLTYQFGWPVFSEWFKKTRNPVLPLVHKNRPLKRYQIVLDGSNIEFDLNRSSLRPDSQARLNSMARFLMANHQRWKTLVLSGHTDERGSDAYNKSLSIARAKSVKQSLVAAGIPSQRIATRGFGENRPLDPGHDERAWQRNRRVEFDFLGVSDVELLSRGLYQTTNVEGVELDDLPPPDIRE